MKASFPVQVAEYAAMADIIDEPAFAWWAPYTIKKRDRIISAQKSRYSRTSHKFGIEIPKTVEQAIALDAKNGNALWQDAIRAEMSTVRVAFKVTDDDGHTPVPGHKPIRCHLIFDVKMDFSRKARFVAGGHMTDPPASITYFSVVSRESVRIAFLLAALNGLDLLAADLKGAYLNAPCRERVCFKAGKELGEDEGKWVVITRAIYGLKSSGAAWRAMFAEALSTKLGFTPCPADPDVWLREAVKPNGEEYYEYILVYVDDILVLSHDPRSIMNRIGQSFSIKEGSDKEPDTYLGADVGKHQFDDDPVPKWTLGADKYVQNALNNVTSWLSDRGRKLVPTKCVLPTGYRPEIDESPYVTEEEANFYSSQIGVLQWAVELCRVDIAMETNLMLSFRAAPRKGHLEAIIHIFGWLKQHPRSKIVFDDSLPPDTANAAVGGKKSWGDFYANLKEELPPNAPKPRGRSVKQFIFVDADLAGCHLTRRSRTGILMFLNRAPVYWSSKKQGDIKPSTYASEMNALKLATEMIEAQRYKLRMMGVPIDGPAEVRCDNASVVFNTSRPESVLKKKNEFINYNYVRERAAMNILEVFYIATQENLADCLTKLQPGVTRIGQVKNILYC
jgi:Reverse transcriptase (RNA-dependent DNA polymerase)